MKFGKVKLEVAVGCILAHSVSLASGKRLRKGILLQEKDVSELKRSGVETVVVATLDEEDVREDDAASAFARLFKTRNIRADTAATGRVNFFAETGGLFRVTKTKIDLLNSLDAGLGVSTLSNFSEVNAGRMVATIKVIPYALSKSTIASAAEIDLSDCFVVEPFKPKRVGLIFSRVEGTKESILDKTRAVLETRLVNSGAVVTNEFRVPHEVNAVSDALNRCKGACDLIIIFGASAISDVADVIPEGIEVAGGEIIRFGMPVDPGNLLLLARLGDQAVIGAPGCARSPAENGFDWILNRLLADIEISSADISTLGVGGLLMETGARPHPRAASKKPVPKVYAVVMAAGKSSRMGKTNKLTVEIDGKPMIRQVVETALASKADKVIVITGHEPQLIHSALDGCEVTFVNNENYAAGLSSSLKSAVSASEDASHMLVLLGDMPFISSTDLNQMIEVCLGNLYKIVMATADGKRGNPVLWPKHYFERLGAIVGDVGARHIIAEEQGSVLEVEIGENALLDLDTPDAFKPYSPPTTKRP